MRKRGNKGEAKGESKQEIGRHYVMDENLKLTLEVDDTTAGKISLGASRGAWPIGKNARLTLKQAAFYRLATSLRTVDRAKIVYT